MVLRLSSILLSICFLCAENIVYEHNLQHEINYDIKDDVTINVNLILGNVSINEIENNNQQFITINTEGAYNSKATGKPQLPQFNQLIEIPAESNCRIEIIEKNSEVINLNNYTNFKVVPSQASIPKTLSNAIEFEYDENFYNKNEFTNSNLVEVDYLGKLREVEIGNVTINPFQYNPKTNELIIHTKINFNIHFDNANLILSKENKNKFSSPYFESIYNTSLINYESPYKIENQTRQNDFINDNVTYLIIANSTFEGYLDEFIDWKNKKGYNVIVAYTNEIGTSSSSIKAYIQEQYNNPENNLASPSFVLLIGDTQQIPASYSSGGHVSDLDYCDMTNDNIPDILCGRFSAQSPSHLQSQIDKTLEYEQYTMPDPSFLGEVIMISGVDASFAPTYGNGQINYGNNYYFNSNNNINSNTFLYPASGSSGSQILNLANQGAAFINYTAHGWESGWADPEFDNNDANNMSNNHKYPTMVGNCCLTNAFDSGSCFGETLLRKSNGGAIGYIGGSDVTYWDEDFWWGVGSGNINVNPSYNSTGEGAYDGMFHENNEENWAVVNSAIIMVGNLAVAQANGMDDYYWEIYHLMGDPSLSTYIGIPSINSVSFDPFLPIGSEALEIQAEPFSYVGLSQNGELISSGMVEESGYIVLVFDPISEPGTLELTVTGQNLQPYYGEIFASSPDGAYVTVNEVNLNSGIDNLISLGETISLEVTLENVGNLLANDVTINLSETTNSPYINIIDSFYSLDGLMPNENSIISLNIAISQEAPFGHSFHLILEVVSENNTHSTDISSNIEYLIDSFESESFDDFPWEISNGNTDWSISMGGAQGLYTSRSGTIDDNMNSELSITVDVVEDGEISFYKKVSCEDVGSQTGNYYDYLAFYIDGVEQSKWAGEQDWSMSSFDVNTGEHVFTWKYIKDQGVSSGQDAAWVDEVIFPPVFNNMSLGDVNGDTQINIQDTILTVNIILNSSNYNEAADMNSDDIIDVLDVIILVNMILQG